MRDVIKKVLAEWLLKFSRNDEEKDSLLDSSEISDEDRDRVFWLNYYLMGVALFLGDVAEASNDMELLGMATRSKKIANDKLDEKTKGFEEYQQSLCDEGSEWNRPQQAALDAGRAFFATIPASVIEMSSHRQAVEKARPFFSNPRDYLDLLSYTDERKVLKRIKLDVKGALCSYVQDNNGEIPAPEWMRDKFDAALRDAYRRADQYVPARIKRGAPQSMIAPIGADAPPRD